MIADLIIECKRSDEMLTVKHLDQLILYLAALPESKMGILTPESMRKYRKHAVVLTLILSAIITPPDVSSQILVSIPILFLYEFSIFISRMVVRKAKKKAST